MSRRACVAHALLRAVSRLLSTPRLRPSRRRHECRRGTQECVRHEVPWERFLCDSPLVKCPDDSGSDLGEIGLEGPPTLAGAISRFSAPSVWRVLFGPVDFGVSNTQKVDSWEPARK